LISDKYTDNLLKITLNPIKENKEIIQIFYHDKKQNKFGIFLQKSIYWYQISSKERTISYHDSHNNKKFVCYCYVYMEEHDNKQEIK